MKTFILIDEDKRTLFPYAVATRDHSRVSHWTQWKFAATRLSKQEAAALLLTTEAPIKLRVMELGVKRVVATYETKSFSFLIIGNDEQHARDLMAAAWKKHCEQTGADLTYFNADDVNVTEVHDDFVVLRDGEVLQVGDVTIRS